MRDGLDRNGNGVIDGVTYRGGLPDDDFLAEAFRRTLRLKRHAAADEGPSKDQPSDSR